MKIVAVDVDETVADLLGEWLRRYNERSGDRLLPEDVDRWAISELLVNEWRENKQWWYDILIEPDLYQHVLPIMGARRAVQRLKINGCRVIFASSCPAGTEHHKIAWLRRYGFLSDDKDFVSARDKSLVNADFLIDDGPHNVETFRGQAYLVAQPHNLNCDMPNHHVVRVPDLATAVDHILARSL